MFLSAALAVALSAGQLAQPFEIKDGMLYVPNVPGSRSEPGRARQLCPGISDVDFLRDLDRVVDLDAEVANRALDLGVAKQELNGSKVPGSSVDQRRLGPPE